MNLQPIPIAKIPIGKPLPWQVYDRNGYTLFVRGELIADRQHLKNLIKGGFFRDVDALPHAEQDVPWVELKDGPPSDLFPPMGIKPQVGERVVLRLLGRAIQDYYRSSLVGYIKNQSILFATPAVAGRRMPLIDGEQMEVRMLTGRNIYAFQSDIVRACTSPSHYFHLRYPSVVRMHKLRGAPRAQVNIVAAFSGEDGASVMAEISNLGTDGAQLRTSHPVGKEGTSVNIAFQVDVDGDDASLSLRGVIQHVRRAIPVDESGPLTLDYAVSFANVSAENRLWLKCVVYKYIAEGYLA